MTYREIIYMVLDELKVISDDAYFEEEHILFLVDKYRAFILKQRYSDIRKQIPDDNYQLACLHLSEVPAISGEMCEGGTFLKSNEKIPYIMNIGNPKVHPENYYVGELTYVSRERMRYVGKNKYLSNFIYCSIGPDSYLYIKSYNPQFLALEKVQMSAIFSSAIEAYSIGCNNTNIEIIDTEFPLEDSLVPLVIEMIVKDLSRSVYAPEDRDNDTKDNLSEVQSK